MKQDENQKWRYDKEEFLAMTESERDNMMFYLADLLNDFGDYARETHKIADWMCKLI